MLWCTIYVYYSILPSFPLPFFFLQGIPDLTVHTTLDPSIYLILVEVYNKHEHGVYIYIHTLYYALCILHTSNTQVDLVCEHSFIYLLPFRNYYLSVIKVKRVLILRLANLVTGSNIAKLFYSGWWFLNFLISK